MSNKYSEIYTTQPVGFEFGEGMIILGTRGMKGEPCVQCGVETGFYDKNFNKFLCSEECRGNYWSKYARECLTGYFKDYLVIYKNRTRLLFPDVRVWFSGRYLYYEQLYIPEYPKGRIDSYEIANIEFGQKYEPEVKND